MKLTEMNNTVSPNKSQIKSLRKTFTRQHLVAFFQENYRGDMYSVMQGYAYYMSKLFRVQKCGNISICIPRSLLAAFAGCHIDTVSSSNLRLEEEGLLSFRRAFKKVNEITCSSMHALLEFFGYLPEWLYFRLKSTSLSNLKDISYLYTISKSCQNREFFNQELPEKERISEICSSTMQNSPLGLRTRTLVLRPIDGVCYINRNEQCNINLSKLWDYDEKIKAQDILRQELEEREKNRPVVSEEFKQSLIERLQKKHGSYPFKVV